MDAAVFLANAPKLILQITGNHIRLAEGRNLAPTPFVEIELINYLIFFDKL
jgi:hypothetical protein